MPRNWENIFSSWATPPGRTEQERCENAEKAIKNAIASSDKLKQRNIKVFPQGSYKNRTNVRKDSDVDIGILCNDTFFMKLPKGYEMGDFGIKPATYHYEQFKNEVEEALVGYFGRDSVKRGNKAFDLKENSYRVEADVAPFFEHRRYPKDGSYLSGVELRPDNGRPPKVINWPEQHYQNGVSKNTDTNRRFKSLVRITKSLCNEMADNGNAQAQQIMGFLLECLIWNVPNDNFGHHTWTSDVRACLMFLFNNTMKDDQCSEWGEVSDLKYLFGPSQKWTRQEAHQFISDAWDYIGFT